MGQQPSRPFAAPPPSQRAPAAHADAGRTSTVHADAGRTSAAPRASEEHEGPAVSSRRLPNLDHDAVLDVDLSALEPLSPETLVDLMLAAAVRREAETVLLQPDESAYTMQVRRGNVTVARLAVSDDVGTAAAVRLAALTSLDPLADASTPEGRGNVTRMSVRVDDDDADILVSITASAVVRFVDSVVAPSTPAVAAPVPSASTSLLFCVATVVAMPALISARTRMCAF